jgi:hypothetical protein
MANSVATRTNDQGTAIGMDVVNPPQGLPWRWPLAGSSMALGPMQYPSQPGAIAAQLVRM